MADLKTPCCDIQGILRPVQPATINFSDGQWALAEQVTPFEMDQQMLIEVEHNGFKYYYGRQLLQSIEANFHKNIKTLWT